MAVHLLQQIELQTSQGQLGQFFFFILVTSLGIIKVKTNNELKVNLWLSLLPQTLHALVLCLLMLLYLFIYFGI